MSGWLWKAPEAAPVVYPELSSPKTLEDYEKLLQGKIDEILGYVASNDGWTPVAHSEPDVELFEKANGDNLYVPVKAKGVVNKPPAQIFDMLRNITLEKVQKWEKDMQGLDAKEVSAEKGINLIHAKFAAPFPVTGREFVNAKVSRQLPDGRYVVVQTSINHDDFLSDPNYVRGVVHISGYVFSAVEGDPSRTLVYRVTQVDPKGSIPLAVINMFKGKAAGTITHLRNFNE